MICCPLAYNSSHLTELYPSYLAQILGFWVTCGVKIKMMSLHHGWDWGPDLKQISPSILDINKVFVHIYMLSIGIQQPSYRVIPILFGSDFGVLGHLWSQNDVNTSWLRLTATSNCFPHPYYTYTKCLSTLICCPLAYSSSLIQLYQFYITWIRFWASRSLVESKWCHYVKVEANSHLKLLSSSILHIYKVFEHIDMLCIDNQ